MQTPRKAVHIKAAAREHLLGNYGRIIPIQVFFFLMCSLLTSFSQEINGTDTLSLVVAQLLFFISNCLVESLNFGLSKTYLKLCCGEGCSFADLFSLTRDNRAVLLSVFMGFLRSVAGIPLLIGAASYVKEPDRETAAAALLAYLVFSLIVFLIKLPFMMSYYLPADMKDMTAGEILKMSAWLMKGNKIKMTAMLLSFIPMIFLSIFSLGLARLWIDPYIKASLACFYLDTAASKSAA